MSSEASKIRNQCARKYGLREKAYKERIVALQSQLDEANAKLSDYDSMKRNYLKLLIYCGLSERDKEWVLQSREIEQSLRQYADFLGTANSGILREIAHRLFSSGKSMPMADILKQAEQQGLLEQLKKQVDE